MKCLKCVAACSSLRSSANVRCQMEVITDSSEALHAARLLFQQCLHQAAFWLRAKIILHSHTAAFLFALHYLQFVRQSDSASDHRNTWEVSVRSLSLTDSNDDTQNSDWAFTQTHQTLWCVLLYKCTQLSYCVISTQTWILFSSVVFFYMSVNMSALLYVLRNNTPKTFYILGCTWQESVLKCARNCSAKQ